MQMQLEATFLQVRPSSDVCAAEEFAYADRYVYVGELESSDPRARYDLLPSRILLIRPPIQISP